MFLAYCEKFSSSYLEVIVEIVSKDGEIAADVAQKRPDKIYSIGGVVVEFVGR